MTCNSGNKVLEYLGNILLCHYIQLFSYSLTFFILLLLLSDRLNFFQREILLDIDSSALDESRFPQCYSVKTLFDCAGTFQRLQVLDHRRLNITEHHIKATFKKNPAKNLFNQRIVSCYYNCSILYRVQI